MLQTGTVLAVEKAKEYSGFLDLPCDALYVGKMPPECRKKAAGICFSERELGIRTARSS
jgi:hypothetical protein